MLLCRVDRWRTWVSLSVTVHTRTNVQLYTEIEYQCLIEGEWRRNLGWKGRHVQLLSVSICPGRPRVQSFYVNFLEPLFCTISTAFPTLPAFDVIETTRHTLSTHHQPTLNITKELHHSTFQFSTSHLHNPLISHSPNHLFPTQNKLMSSGVPPPPPGARPPPPPPPPPRPRGGGGRGLLYLGLGVAAAGNFPTNPSPLPQISLQPPHFRSVVG